jgi:lipopolysaccharide transport system permease protein
VVTRVHPILGTEQPATKHPLEVDFPVTRVGALATNVWRHRELLWHLALRNLRSQYKQSMLGYAWILVSPAVYLLTFTFVFSTVLRTPSEGVPFPLFLCVGLVPWLFFSGALLFATESISGAASLVTMVYFPREILTVSAVLVRVLDLAAGLVILVGLLAYHGYGLGPTAAWVPAIFLLHLLFTVGLSLPLAALNLFFHDVRFLVGVGLNLWFFLTPVMYPMEIVPARYLFLYDLNPNAWLVEMYRDALLHGKSPAAEDLVWCAGVALSTLAAGYYFFKRLEPGFADRI